MRHDRASSRVMARWVKRRGGISAPPPPLAGKFSHHIVSQNGRARIKAVLIQGDQRLRLGPAVQLGVVIECATGHACDCGSLIWGVAFG